MWWWSECLRLFLEHACLDGLLEAPEGTTSGQWLSLVSCLAPSLLFGSLFQKHIVCWNPPFSLAFSYLGFFIVLAQFSLLCWPPLVHEKFLSIFFFFCLIKAVTLSYSSSEPCTDYLLSSEFPRLEWDPSPPEHSPYAQDPERLYLLSRLLKTWFQAWIRRSRTTGEADWETQLGSESLHPCNPEYMSLN